MGMNIIKNARISIVIPVYNEADHLADCLWAIARQTTAPYEVIVVDNNSTDDTLLVAGSFKFVRIIHERRQGVVHARTKGFNAANGDIIGRIDADTLLSADWVATTQKLFETSAVDAVSGAVSYHDLPWRSFLARLDLGFRQWIAQGMADEVFLFGSNMALRRSVWRQVRGQLCSVGGMHEDFDLAIHLHDAGAVVRFDRRMLAAVSLRRFDVSLRNYWAYVWRSPATYRLHGKHSQLRMYPVILLVVSQYWMIRLLYRSYNPADGSLTLRNLLLQRAPLRIDPTSNVV
jgi:glycosyltransferase involved in cell wall biosynthesis